MVGPRQGLRALVACFILVLLPGVSPRAEGAEAGAFDTAAEEFRAGFWKSAEADLSDFAKTYPESTNLPYAFLCQAVARFHQTNYAGTIDLLSGHQAQAGKLADDYLFWQAKALQAKGDSAASAESFKKLIQQFPTSRLCLEASVEEAQAQAKLGDWSRVIELLRKPDGIFQKAVGTNASNEAILTGWLLLGEAQLARQDYAGVEEAVKPLAGLHPNPSAAWHCHYLVSRLRMAQGHPEEALAASSNLLAEATGAGDPAQLAETYAFLAGVFARLNRTNEAINAFTNNLAGGISAERQTQALTNVTKLLIAADRLPEAVARLEAFTEHVPDPPADLALVLLGELRLKQDALDPGASRAEAVGTNAPPATHYLDKATAALTRMTQKFTNSLFLGRAELDLGWCYWEQRKWRECQDACQAAVGRLPDSPLDQATARFKLADALFMQTNYAGAVTQYQNLIAHYGDLPQVKTNLIERALYQMARAGLAGGDWPSVTDAVAKILAWYPNGFHTHPGALPAGQDKGRPGDPAGLREMFTNVLERMPDSPLAPQIGIAIARTFEQENKLPEAVAQYKLWLERFPTNSARSHVEYCLAMSEFLVGDTTNALARLTNFVAHVSPADPLKPIAQLWIADYYYRTDKPIEAERLYTELALSTNLPSAELAYQARMMAGRSALSVQGWDRAINHFTNLTSDARLTSDTTGPKPIWVEAMFAYANALMSRGAESTTTNKAGDFKEAMSVFTGVFTEIKRTQPTNRLAAAALGERANCFWQLAQLTGQPDLLTNAIEAYKNAMAFPGADIKVRSMAEVGLGLVLEKQARQKPAPEQGILLNQALTNYLHVFFGEILLPGEPPDPFWVKKAGIEAARLAEDLGLLSPAKNVYGRLEEVLPPLRASMEAKRRKVSEIIGTP